MHTDFKGACWTGTLLGLALFAQSALAARAVTPDQALQKLKEGNGRYMKGETLYARVDPARRVSTAIEGQKPIASVLSCSDARVPPEIIFDQRFANLFVVRVAGNVCGISELASLEYGVKHLNTPLVVVLGHSQCGAVQAAMSGAQLDGNLPRLMEMMGPMVTRVKAENPKLKDSELSDTAVRNNVWHSIEELLRNSPTVATAVKNKSIKLVGAVRDIKAGTVTWLGEHPRQASLVSGAQDE